MMHPVALFDSVTLAGAALALLFMLRGSSRNFRFSSKIILAGLFGFTALYGACLIVEWTGVTDALDRIEDHIGATLPVWWIAVFYALYQEVAAQDLDASRERLQLALEGASDGLWDYEPKSGRVFFGPRVFTMLGYEPDAFPHAIEEWRSRVHPEDVDGAMELLERFLHRETDTYAAEFRMRTADGRWRWILSRGKAAAWAADDSVLRVVGTHADITAQKKAEYALRESEQRYRVLFETAPDAIVTLAAPHWRFASVNPAAVRLFAAPDAAALLTRTPWDVSPPHQPDGQLSEAKLRAALDSALRTGAGRLSWWHRRLDGTAFLAEALWTRVALAGDTFLQGNLRDITRQTELEDQLRQSQKMEAVGQLAGGVAHDFNNLLQVIAGYGSMAIEESRDAAVRQSLEEMLKASERARLLVSQLLAFGRRQVFSPETIEVNAAVTGVIAMLERIIGEHVRIRFHSAGRGLYTYADRGMFEQVLMNLCLNARDAMPNGGVLTIEAGLQDLPPGFADDNAWAPPGRYAVVRVSDTGSGMDRETRSRIFEPFFTTKPKGKGSGLGLATVYGIVKQHNGAITCESETGKGTRFNVFLPASEVSATVVERRDLEAAAGGSETILLAEDEEMVRTLAVVVLERAGYTVRAVATGEEAVRAYEADPGAYDLLLLDVVMPDMGGYEAYRRIRALRGDMPVLFVSGYSHTELGAEEEFPLVQKPYTRDALLAAVRDVLLRVKYPRPA